MPKLQDIAAAIARDPLDETLWFQQSELLSKAGRLSEAAESASRAIALNGASYQAWFWLANALAGMGRWEMAKQAAETCLGIAPNLPVAKWALAHAQMALGEWAEAFTNYEYGFLSGKRSVRCLEPQWDGQRITGKTLFVWGEQGHGDQIQMVRYLEEVRARSGAHVILECRPALLSLFEGMADCVIATQDAGCNRYQVDYHAPLMSLPRILGVSEPVGTPYLRCEQKEPSGKIGLAWKGSPSHSNDSRRSLPPEQVDKFRPYMDQLVPLQEGMGEKHYGDFAALAETIERLDAVISVDTAVAHLAGAMGKPVYLLAQLDFSEPRWGTGSRTAWYDSFQVYHSQNWESVDRVITDVFGKTA